jgi:hypothetical protein
VRDVFAVTRPALRSGGRATVWCDIPSALDQKSSDRLEVTLTLSEGTAEDVHCANVRIPS